MSLFIFIGFELSHEEDLFNNKDKLNSINKINLLCYIIMQDNIILILEKIIEKINIYITNYSVKILFVVFFLGVFQLL